MEPVIWDIYVVHPEDVIRFWLKKIKWEDVRKIFIRAFVDTGATRTIIFHDVIEKLQLGLLKEKLMISGICEESFELPLSRLGIAIEVNGRMKLIALELPLFTKNHIDNIQTLKKLREDYNVNCILGRDILDILSIGIDPKTRKPMEIPAMIL